MADRRAVWAAAIALLALAGCNPGDTDRLPGERTTAVSTPTVRTDAEPITKRFPRLGAPAELHWLGGAAGQDTGGVPGPTDVRIQALVKVAPEVTVAAAKDYSWTPAPAGWEKAIPETLLAYVPKDAEWQTSKQFATDVSTTRYSGAVYFDPASNTVWLDVTGS